MPEIPVTCSRYRDKARAPDLPAAAVLCTRGKLNRSLTHLPFNAYSVSRLPFYKERQS